MQEPTGPSERRVVLIVTALGSFLTPYMGSAVNVALPAIGAELHLGPIGLAWVSLSYLVTSAAFLVPFGRLADLHGRKRLLLLGLVLHSFASLLLVASTSASFLLACRAAQGLGSAMLFCSGIAMLVSAFPASERGRALGLNVAAVYLGLTLGPPSGGLLVAALGWRSIFWLGAVLGFCALTLARLNVRHEWADARGEPFDAGGAVLYVLTVLAATVALASQRMPWRCAGGGLAIVCGVAFALWEARSTHPVLDVRLFRRNLGFTLSNVAALIHYAATFGVGFLLSLYLQDVRGLSPKATGLLLLSQPLLMMLFSPLAGRLSDKFQPRVVASLGMTLTTLALAGLALLTEAPLAAMAGLLALLGLGFAFFSSPNANAIMSSVARSGYGVASAILSTMRLLGNVFSMGLVTLALAFHGSDGAQAGQTAFVHAMKMTLAGYACLSVLAIGASLARGNIRQEL